MRLKASADAEDRVLCDSLVHSSTAQCALALKLKLLAPNPDSCHIPYKETRLILWNFTIILPAIGERAYDEVPDLYSDISSKVSRASTELSGLFLHSERIRVSSPDNAPIARESQPKAASLQPPSSSALDSQGVSTPTGHVIGMTPGLAPRREGHKKAH